MLILFQAEKRGMGGRLSLHPVAACDPYDIGMPNRDLEFNHEDHQSPSRVDDE